MHSTAMKVAIVAAGLMAAAPATAQECIGTVDAYISLSQNYGEQRLVVTVLPDGRIIEVWVNPETETWSLFITTPDGVSCSVGSGVGFALNPLEPNV